MTNIVKKLTKMMAILFNPLPEEVKKPKIIDSPESPKVEEVPLVKDKIFFQANTIQSKNSIEFPSTKNPSIANEAVNLNEKERTYKIVIECNDAAILHLQSLCRFFEINQFEAIARGIWLLSIARDIEIGDKKIGIISLDQNGFVTNVTPINLV